MTQNLPALSIDDIKQLAHSQSFERGQSYYRSGAVLEPVQRGNELQAYCEGSDYEPYRLSVTLDEQGIDSLHCTCPYDWGGICKHLVALLLTWVHTPDAFDSRPPLDESLAQRSKEELISLIKEMLKREPDLARLLELSIQPDRQSPLNMDAYRRQIQYALSKQDYDRYPYTDEVAAELDALADTAARFAEADDWTHAGEIYALILAEVVSNYDELQDEDGNVSVVLQRCAEALDDCFIEGKPDTDTRRHWLEALLEGVLKDIEMGGMDLVYPANDLVVGHPNEEEWSWIEERIRQRLENQTDKYSDWEREALVGVLADRLQLQEREEAVDELILSEGSPRQQAFLLVERQQFEEAIAIAHEHFTDLPGLVKRFADALVEAGAGEQAVAYMTSQLGRARHPATYQEWLAKHAKQEGKLEVALEHWQQNLQQSPNFSTYQSICGVAREMGQWDDIRPGLLDTLEKQEAWTTLIEIALDEEDVERAARLLRSLKGRQIQNYRRKVAQAAESGHPNIAIRLYQQEAEALINARGRDNYQTAARLLTRVRDLYQEQNQADEWQEHISDLRQDHSNLPALQDELNKAGL